MTDTTAKRASAPTAPKPTPAQWARAKSFMESCLRNNMRQHLVESPDPAPTTSTPESSTRKK